jgi:intein-encoded DNA endonuclease-like protein
MPIEKKINENFFKKWSLEMAYVLGFFAADGCMMKNKRGAHFIEFQITDKDILLKIRKCLGSNHKISIREEKDNCKTRYRLQIGSKIIFSDLSKLGFTPRKSNTIKFPSIPDRYFSHFARGYFDGDGNVYANTYKRAVRGGKLSITLLSGFTCGNREFLGKLHLKLRNTAHISGGTLYKSKSGVFRLYFSVKDSGKMYRFMYNDVGNLCLLRKKVVFENYFTKRRLTI